MADRITHRTEDRIVLPADVVEAIAEDVAMSENPTPADVRDRAFGRLDRRTAFVTEDGDELTETVLERV